MNRMCVNISYLTDVCEEEVHTMLADELCGDPSKFSSTPPLHFPSANFHGSGMAMALFP